MTPESSGATWPTETDLVFPPGVTKLMMTNQQPLVQAIIQDAIENLRASLMFNHAFPDGTVAFTFTKESLITATKSYKPGAAHIQCQLLQDEDYLVKIAQLVCFINVTTTSLTLCNSHVLGSHFCRVKSRSTAMLLAYQHYLPLDQQIILLRWFVVTSRNRSINFSLFYPMLTFSLRLMVTHRLDSCDHLLYRLMTRYVLVSLLLS